jgi:hypothetical protein
MIAQDGTGSGEGPFLIWKGALSEAPANPHSNWAYYNITQKATYVFDGSAWQILFQDSSGTPVFMKLADLSVWLNNQSGGSTTANPIFTVYAGSETPAQLYDVLGTIHKYVNLDLSLSTVIDFASGTEEGRKYIISLRLPRNASIASGTEGNATFKQFINLKNLYGSDGTIGEYAFAGLTNLESIHFSNTMAIQKGAFSGCTSLATVDCPKMGTISEKVFMGCESLTSLNLPALSYIHKNALDGCIHLQTVSSQALSMIREMAFKDCIELASITMGSTPPTINTNAFNGIARSPRTLTFYVPSVTPYQGWVMYSRIGANNSVGYVWDWDSPYKDNLTIALSVGP